MSQEKSSNTIVASQLINKIEDIKSKLDFFEEKMKENNMALEREKAKYDMYVSQLKEMGYNIEDIEKVIEELTKEIENGIREAESVCSEAGIKL
jgi:chromosome segregation ATPase